MGYKDTIKERKYAIASLHRIKTGTGLQVGHKIPSNTIMMWGCKVCAWIGTAACPHGIQIGEHHANKICATRIKYLQEEYEKCGNIMKLIQQEELMKARLVEDKFLNEFVTGGELHPDFHKIQRNIVTLTDKMRKQDEGIKIQGDLNITLEDFRKVVDIQAEHVKDKDIIKEAELMNDNKPNN
jgi:hypothetical protein